MSEEFTQSRSRAFSNLWPVAPEYRIVDGHVCPLIEGEFIQRGASHSFKSCETYLPMAHPELPGELAKVASGREDDLLAFVRRYGLLGYGLAWRIPEEVVGARLIEGGHDEEKPALRGDPFPWVLAHAQTVQLLLELLGRLDDAAALRLFFETMTVRLDEQTTIIDYRYAHRGYLYPKKVQSVWSWDEPRDAAFATIAHVLNPNIQGVSRSLVPELQDDGKQGLSSLFNPCNLLDCIYWHLADAFYGGWVRRCADPECGSFFVAKSRRVKYCPPPMGYRGVSPCMNRHKQQRHRRNRREK